MKNGDIVEEGSDLLQDDMTFRLDDRPGSKKEHEDPMWASSSSAAADWLFDEGS